MVVELIHIRQRVFAAAADADFQMEMRAGGAAGRTLGGNGLALGDCLADFDINFT